MTDRYAFCFEEHKRQQEWKNKVFQTVVNDNTLLNDGICRLKGLPYINSPTDSKLLCLGILSHIGNDKYSGYASLVKDFGADTVRLCAWEGKVGEQNLTAYWRFINATYLFLQDFAPATPTNLELLPFDNVVEPLLNFDFKSALPHLKSFVTSRQYPSTLFYFLYPFAPHLITTLSPDIHSKMPSFWDKLCQTPLQKNFFIEINGRFCASLPVMPQDEKEKIIKQALSLPSLQRKIEQKRILKIIFIEDKGVNFVV